MAADGFGEAPEVPEATATNAREDAAMTAKDHARIDRNMMHISFRCMPTLRRDRETLMKRTGMSAILWRFGGRDVAEARVALRGERR
jgi:hypothetical protein